MAEPEAAELRRLAAELRGEIARIERTVRELESLGTLTSQPRTPLYAAAALLDTFYTGVEKAFTRIASSLGGVPSGSA